MTFAEWLPLAVVGIVFIIFCVFDLFREQTVVRWLPKWVWLIIIIISVPLGGIIYLIIGKER